MTDAAHVAAAGLACTLRLADTERRVVPYEKWPGAGGCARCSGRTA